MIIPKSLKIFHEKFTLYLIKTIENNCGEIEKDYEAMGKAIKDLTLSYMDKLGVLWDDKKKNRKKFDY